MGEWLSDGGVVIGGEMNRIDRFYFTVLVVVVLVLIGMMVVETMVLPAPIHVSTPHTTFFWNSLIDKISHP